MFAPRITLQNKTSLQLFLVLVKQPPRIDVSQSGRYRDNADRGAGTQSEEIYDLEGIRKSLVWQKTARGLLQKKPFPSKRSCSGSQSRE